MSHGPADHEDEDNHKHEHDDGCDNKAKKYSLKKLFLFNRSRIRVTPRFFEYKVRLDCSYNFQNLCAQFQWPIKDFAIDSENDFLQVVWPNRGGGFGKISLSHN